MMLDSQGFSIEFRKALFIGGAPSLQRAAHGG